MPYVIVYEDGQSVELRGSADSQQGNVLFTKLGLSDRTKTSASKKRDLPDIKCEYFTILEKSGFQLISSNSCNDPTLTGKHRIVREYIFHKQEDHSSARGSGARSAFGEASPPAKEDSPASSSPVAEADAAE